MACYRKFCVIRTPAHQEKVDKMITNFKKMKMDVNCSPYNYEYLILYIIQVHSRIQQIIWKGGLIRDIEKYKAMRSVLPEFHQKRILDYLWDTEPGIKKYKSVVKKFVLQYLYCDLDSIKGYTTGYKLRSGRQIRSNFTLIPNGNYKLPQELYDKFISSIPVHLKLGF